MTKRFLITAVLICGLTAFAGRALAEEKSDAKKDMLNGHATIILVLRSDSGPTPSFDVNKGGLLIVEIPDSGSRPPQDMSVKASDTFEQLGKLRGINLDRRTGKSLMGGGYTWFLFKPIKESKAERVEVKYTPNGDGSAPKTSTYKVEVTAAD